MREDIKLKNRSEDEIINTVIEHEWAMFDKVNNIGGRAGCQDDEWTFYVNRYSQFSSFGTEVLYSYYSDIRAAEEEGRNLITEKYAYMMEFTHPEYYKSELEPHIPAADYEKMELIQKITDIQLRQEKAFSESYPYFAGKGRPLTGSDADFVSFKIYSIGELKTYSKNTLKLLLREFELSENAEHSISYRIHLSTALFYGYSSLEDAEKSLRKR